MPASHTIPPPPVLTPYLLVGGLSTRMGTDKAFLVLHGRTLLEHALHRLQTFGPATLLNGNPANESRRQQLAAYARTVPDRTPDAGPLGGIDAALHDCQTVWALILPIDQPNLPTQVLQHWTAEVLATGAKASWLTQPTGPEPLPVLLHRSLAIPIAHALNQGDRKLIPTLRRLAGPSLLASPQHHPEWFLNLNQPRDLADVPAPVEISPSKNLSSPQLP